MNINLKKLPVLISVFLILFISGLAVSGVPVIHGEALKIAKEKGVIGGYKYTKSNVENGDKHSVELFSFYALNFRNEIYGPISNKIGMEKFAEEILSARKCLVKSRDKSEQLLVMQNITSFKSTKYKQLSKCLSKHGIDEFTKVDDANISNVYDACRVDFLTPKCIGDNIK